MILFPNTNDLLEIAKRTVWFKPPEESLKHPYHFIAHVLTFGSYVDVQNLKKYISDNEFKEALKNAPPGVFDPRSWAYWNIKFGINPPPPMPKRILPE